MATLLADGDVEIDAREVMSTAKAILVEVADRQVWLPRRYVSIQDLGNSRVIVRMRRWVATEKKLY